MTQLLAFLLTMGVLVVFHEYGHYRVARAFGVKVARFSVGFGRVLWRHQRSKDDTEFVVCALPLGGYVRWIDDREHPPIGADEERQTFRAQPLHRRAAIVAAGPLANLLLAVLLYAAANWIGIDEPKAVLGPPVARSLADKAGMKSGEWVRAWSGPDGDWRDVPSLTELRWQVTQAAMHGQPVRLQLSDREGRGSRTVTLDLAGLEGHEVDAALMKKIGLGGAFSQPVLGEVKAGGAAAAGGLRKGDRVLAVDGSAVLDAQTLRERIRASAQGGAAQPQHWRVDRAGQAVDLDVTPRAVKDGEATIGRVDAFIGLPPEMVTVQRGPIEGLQQGIEKTWEVSALTVRMLGRMLVGQASLKNLSGPLTIADYAGQAVTQGLAYYLGFLALVSVSLGVLNLLPVPVLDGGHLMYYIFEAATGRPISELWLARLQRGGLVVLLMMMSVALFNDLAGTQLARFLSQL